METAVLDEDGAGIDAGDRAAGDEQSRHICLERLGIVDRRVAIVERHAGVFEQRRVGAIAGQQVDHIGRNLAARPAGRAAAAR